MSRLRSVKEQKNNPERNKTDLSDKGRERERHTVRVTWQQHRASGWLIMRVLKARESRHNKKLVSERDPVRATMRKFFDYKLSENLPISLTGGMYGDRVL